MPLSEEQRSRLDALFSETDEWSTNAVEQLFEDEREEVRELASLLANGKVDDVRHDMIMLTYNLGFSVRWAVSKVLGKKLWGPEAAA